MKNSCAKTMPYTSMPSTGHATASATTLSSYVHEGCPILRAEDRLRFAGALGWTDDSIVRILEGRDPVAVEVEAAGGRLTTKPPLEPTGTITAFFTIWVFIRPSTSVRKSSRRSDQRMPPRATCPKRRWMPSTRGEYTQISNNGRGAGSSSSLRLSNLNDSAGFKLPSGRRWRKLVRSVERTRLT